MEQAADRRQYPRITTYLPVRLRLQQSGRYLETLAKDVSLGGVRCVVEGRPDVNEVVVLEVPLYKEVLPIQAQARVAWVRPTTDTQSIVGIRFEHLSQADSGALSTYLEHRTAPLASSLSA